MTMAATSIAVTQETRRLLEALKSGGETYDDVIRALVATHPMRLTWAEISRRIRDEEPEGPIEELVARSRKQPY
jgi:predicted CopG family antitoxin